MTIVQIAHEVPADAVARVQAMLAETLLRDVAWSGDSFEIERADFTCIPDAEEIKGTILLQDIYRAIDGEQEP